MFAELLRFAKDNLIFVICVFCLILFMHKFLSKSNEYYYNSIIIQDNVKMKSLSRNITKAYLIISRMENSLTNLLPITKYFSHWMTMVQTDDNKYFMISASPKHFIEIINPNFDGFKKHNIYYYHDRQYYYTIIKEYDNIEPKISVINYAKMLNKDSVFTTFILCFGKYCYVVGETNVGCKRSANEDSLGSAETQNGLIATVCDGMGGHVGGATASQIAVKTIISVFKERYFEDPREGIKEAIIAANDAILSYAASHPELQGMGSTCVLLVVRKGRVFIGHVGDSRIYLIRSHKIKQLTKDHSFVQMLVDSGQITKEQAEHHPRKNEITNALGIPEMQMPTVLEDAINPDAGDCFLLCSDGLSGMVPDSEIERIVSKQKDMRAQERACSLIEKARENGGLDNITVQLVEFSVTPNQINDRWLDDKKNIIKLSIIVGSVALLACLCFFVWKYCNRGSDNDSQPQEQIENGVDNTQHNERLTKKIDLGNLDIDAVNSDKHIIEIIFSDSIPKITCGIKEIILTETEGFCQDSVIVKSDNINVKSDKSSVKIFPKQGIFRTPDDMILFIIGNEYVKYEFSLNVKVNEKKAKTDNNQRQGQAAIPMPSITSPDNSQKGIENKEGTEDNNADKKNKEEGTNETNDKTEGKSEINVESTDNSSNNFKVV